MKYYRLRYNSSIQLYRYFHNLLTDGELDPSVMILPFERLRSDLKAACNEVIEFTGLKEDECLREAIDLQASKQMSYRRLHQVMPIEEFGLTTAQLKKDFQFLLDGYNYFDNEQGNGLS